MGSIAGFLTAGMVLSLAAVFLLLGPFIGSNATRENVRIGAVSAEICSLPWLAEAQGYFAQEGLNVTLTSCETGVEALSALRRGQVDFATSTEYTFVLQSFTEEELRILATLATGDFTQVVTKRSRRISQPSKLRGRRIGYPFGTHSDYYLARFLALHQISPEEITTVDLAPHAQLEALERGQVDALVTSDPYVGRITRRLGSNAVSWSLRDQSFYSLLLGRAANSSDTPGRLLRALLRAEEFLQSNPAEAREIITRALKSEDSEPPWENYEFSVRLPQPLLPVMEDEARWIMETGATFEKRLPNYLHFVNASPLRRVKPSAVTLIQ